ncbi:hypothetical protein PILCRDRAFT_820595 [Piloderma croceum F 1598]|uniref:Natural resistance-associated macrophage protein n=1 Tax=Piloderma croceum (strain F 1598) TaxID=765440 RepID=A0A0C3B7J5_PILCF|nr:hypothetical protein PILCRDRAFT_820595 [Piloderma croceum F 1598]
MAPIQSTEGTKVWYCKQKGRHCTVPRPPLWYSVPCLKYGADVSPWLPPRLLTTICTTLMSTNVPAKILAKPQSTRTQRWKCRLKSAFSTVFNHATKHTGVGIVCAVAYFDPGNWGVDLAAGSEYGYKLLFVILLAGLFAVFLQILASRLGCVTGLDLASHCRLLFYDRPEHKLLYRWLVHYPLYVLSEIAIISTDLAELLGSAIALCMIFPKLPLWAGVLLTAFDVLFILALGDPLRGRPVRMFECLIAALVLSVLICIAIIIAKVNVEWSDAFEGFLPSKTLFAEGALYTSVGILGATVMPHSLFLGSALATQDRISPNLPKGPLHSSSLSEESLERPNEKLVHHLRRLFQRTFDSISFTFRVRRETEDMVKPKCHADRENNTLVFVQAHLYHGIFDMAISLLGFAVIINSLILILASAVFYYGYEKTSDPAGLFDAHDIIQDSVGKAAALLFALALLAAGQSSSIIATVAGQSVSEGFLQWKVSPVVRRLLTRLLGLIPSMVVAAALGRPGINTLLVASQVALAIILPFITFPLIWLTSCKKIMSVRKPEVTLEPGSETEGGTCNPERALPLVDFSSGKIATGVGVLIWLIMVAANAYVIITLAMGKGD